VADWKGFCQMRVNDLVEEFDLVIAAGEKGLDRKVMDGYCGDLLSDVMGNAPAGCAWLTVQAHQNIVAVAVLREMAAIIITGGQKPDEETIQKAEQEGISILLWPRSSYSLAGRFFSAGVGNLATE
jgi:predicted transcriptional regulator